MSPRAAILVVANETSTSRRLLEMIREKSGGAADVIVVAPALNGRIRHWTSDDREARQAAQRRLAQCLGQLAAAGISAQGYVGDADPLQAISDAVRLHAITRIIISTHSPEDSTWLTRNVIDRARTRFTVPIHHVAAHELAAAA